MSLTLITITGRFVRPDGSPAQGTITARCTDTLRNGQEMSEADAVVGRLDDEGELVRGDGTPFRLLATDDPGTTPLLAGYQWTLELDCAPVRSFYAPLPHEGNGGEVEEGEAPTIDIAELEP